MKSWRSFIRNALGVIVMGRLDAPHLAQRVDAILLRSLDIFLSDPDIIERYNLAFSNGWKSPEWQDMPTLRDFTRLCSIARLNISKPEAIDHQAINQITSQIAALLVSPLGNAIALPSSFSPEPMVKFYALTGFAINPLFAATSDTNQNRDIYQTTTETLNKNSSEEIQGFINDMGATLLVRRGVEFRQVLEEVEG